MKLWGPIPRLVLEMVALKQQKVLWQNAKAVSLERLGQFSRGEENRNNYHGTPMRRTSWCTSVRLDKTLPLVAGKQISRQKTFMFAA
jgi:hypothetical protein